MNRTTFLVSVYLILREKNQVVLLRRANTSWMNGHYSLPAGHVDGEEKLTTAMAREAEEEVGIQVEEKNLKLLHMIHRLDPTDSKECFDFFFTCSHWTGEIKNSEPEKCDHLQFFPLDKLPENTVPHVRQLLEGLDELPFLQELGFS